MCKVEKVAYIGKPIKKHCPGLHSVFWFYSLQKPYLCSLSASA